MQRLIFLPALIALAALAACDTTTAETYPLSEEQCGPGDPVLDLDASDCVVPSIGVGT
jgi:hypothetical protein